MAFGMDMEEMAGESKGKSLSQTLQTIMSVVRQSRETSGQVRDEPRLTDRQLQDLLQNDLTKPVKQDGPEAQEQIDLGRIRAALYGD